MKQTLLYIAPHLSTGGMPQYLYAQIEAVINDFNVYCIEWNNVTGGKLVVQRNKIHELLKNRLITLSENKDELFTVINDIRPDIIHIQESPEGFIPQEIAHRLYASPRPYVLIETSHDSTFNVQTKQYLPDKFLLVSQHQIHRYAKLGIPYEVVPYPIIKRTRTKTREQALLDLGLDPKKKHVVNVGLFTPNKNQAEIIEYARVLQNYPIQFHFIGNQADNFREYWEPLMQRFPSNCTWWNERSDVDTFYEMADLFLFTSKLELMPLVVRESLGWEIPSLIYNLPSYVGEFDKYPTIEYLTNDVQMNAYRIAEKLFRGENIQLPAERVYHTMKGEEYLERLHYYSNANDNGIHYGDGAGQYYATYIVKELERNNVIQLNEGDVFVDLGANIGMSSMYAHDKKVGEIHAFEPDPEMQKILNKNVPSAIIYPYAISHIAEEITLYHWPYNDRSVGPTYTTRTITLRDVINLVGKKINYLKIDIEGFERHLFDELTPEECSQIEKMMIEYHDLNSLDTFCNTLRIKGFEIVHVVHGFQAFIYTKYTNRMSI
jgi:FkbM family methyltransferase